MLASLAMDSKLKTSTSSFLSQLWDETIKRYGHSLAHTTLVLPSTRAITKLKEIAASEHEQLMLPLLTTMGSFSDSFLNTRTANSLERLCILFSCFEKVYGPYNAGLGQFQSLGKTILSDFNEIDLALVDPELAFKNLADVQDLEAWAKGDSLSAELAQHNDFWQKLLPLHTLYHKSLEEAGLHDTGSKFRALASAELHTEDTVVFAGFNIMSQAEQAFAQKLISDKGMLVVEEDSSFFAEKLHDSHARKPDIFNPQRDLLLKTCWIKTPPKLRLFSYTHEENLADNLLSLISNPSLFREDMPSAIVVPDSNLVPSLIAKWPKHLKANFTTGYPLSYHPAYGYLSQVLDCLKSWNQDELDWDAFSLLIRPPKIFKQETLDKKQLEFSSSRISISELRNTDLFAAQYLLGFLDKPINTWDEFMFALPWKNEMEPFDAYFIREARLQWDKLTKIIEQANLWSKVDAKAILQWYLQELAGINLATGGDQQQGIQIMGPLEIRNLDFDQLWVLQVNEGIFPGRVNEKSFITNDLRAYLKLPTYQQKEKIYGFYFYRLLYRSKELNLLYRDHPEGEGLGDSLPSRYIKQLERALPKESVQRFHLGSPKTGSSPQESAAILADTWIQEQITNYLQKRPLSGSSIETLIKCPRNFYFKYVLGVPEKKEWGKPSVPALGNLFHETLENTYLEILKNGPQPVAHILPKAKELMQQFLEQELDKIFGGENAGQREVYRSAVLRYLKIWQELEQSRSEDNPELMLIGAEEQLEVPIELEVFGKQIKASLTGKIDRTEAIGEKYRIVDYKSGKFERTDLIQGKGKVKTAALKLYLYQYMYEKAKGISPTASIYSLVNYQSGFLDLNFNEAAIDNDLESFISGLFNEAFGELGLEIEHNKENKYCEFCA